MSITDELRHEVAEYPFRDNRDFALFEAVADRIDAEHQKAMDEWKAEHGQMWLKGYAECHAELLEGNETIAYDLEECGLIRLPKDADGEYIHIGDRMEVINSKQRAEACYMQMGPSGTWAVGLTKNCHWYDTESLRHYHAPTVEDVLREFAEKMNENLGMYTGEAIDADEWRDADAKTVAEYAAKLRLAEEVDA